MKPGTPSTFRYKALDSFRWAFTGLAYAFHTQPHFRFHLAAALVVSVVAVLLHLSATAWAVLVLTMGSVLVVELINTAIESIVDLMSPEYHPLAKIVKDLAAGAVLFVAITAILVGLFILGPPLWRVIAG